MTEFEKAVVAEIERIRETLKIADRSNFDFSVNANGRVQSGDVKITFKLSSNYDDPVTGNAIEPVINEHLRRIGFSERHQGLLLTATNEVVDNDETVAF